MCACVARGAVVTPETAILAKGQNVTVNVFAQTNYATYVITPSTSSIYVSDKANGSNVELSFTVPSNIDIKLMHYIDILFYDSYGYKCDNGTFLFVVGYNLTDAEIWSMYDELQRKDDIIGDKNKTIVDQQDDIDNFEATEFDIEGFLNNLYYGLIGGVVCLIVIGGAVVTLKKQKKTKTKELAKVTEDKQKIIDTDTVSDSMMITISGPDGEEPLLDENQQYAVSLYSPEYRFRIFIVPLKEEISVLMEGSKTQAIARPATSIDRLKEVFTSKVYKEKWTEQLDVIDAIMRYCYIKNYLDGNVNEYPINCTIRDIRELKKEIRRLMNKNVFSAKDAEKNQRKNNNKNLNKIGRFDPRYHNHFSKKK